MDPEPAEREGGVRQLKNSGQKPRACVCICSIPVSHLHCTEEMDAWVLLSKQRVVSGIVSSTAHQYIFPSPKPESQQMPAMISLIVYRNSILAKIQTDLKVEKQFKTAPYVTTRSVDSSSYILMPFIVELSCNGNSSKIGALQVE
jgi:hypothetical protein